MTTKPWINYHHLLYFKTVAIEGGIANAAKKLRLSQPTLSTQMKVFEDTIGHELFDRSKRHLQLTEAGRMVLGYATEIFRLGDEMMDALNDRFVATKIQVQIGAMDTVSKHVIRKVFQKAQESYDCMVAFTEGHGDELLRELRSHRLDLVISNYSPPVVEMPGFYAKSIVKMPVAICGSNKFAKLKRNFPASLQDQPFVMPSLQSRLRFEIENYLKSQNIRVNVVAEIQDSSLQTIMGTYGDGLIPVALPAVEDLIANKSLSIIGVLKEIHEELWFIAGQRRLQNPVAAAIMKDFRL